jgi:NADH:ubiquinone oxidoreductase subunit F (NADH-binding)
MRRRASYAEPSYMKLESMIQKHSALHAEKGFIFLRSGYEVGIHDMEAFCITCREGLQITWFWI